MTHAETVELLRARGLSGRRVRCFGDPSLAVLEAGAGGGGGVPSGGPVDATSAGGGGGAASDGGVWPAGGATSDGAYDVAVVGVDRAGLAEATKAVRALVGGLAADGVVVTSVAHPCVAPPGSTWAAYPVYAGWPEGAAYAGDAWHGPAYAEPLAAHAAEFEGLGLRTQVVHLRAVTLVVATRPAVGSGPPETPLTE